MSGRPPLGEIKVGDELIVLPSNGGRVRREAVRVRVTKAARVWLETTEIEQASSRARSWRMRRDTQNEGSGYSTQGRFLTSEQYAWEAVRNEASTFLRDQGINVDMSSPWRDRLPELADAIKTLL